MSRSKQFKDEKFIKNLSAELNRLSVEKKLTHEVLSDRAGLDTRQIGRILRGENNYSVSHFAVVCKALGVHPAEVLKRLDFPIDETFNRVLKD